MNLIGMMMVLYSLTLPGGVAGGSAYWFIGGLFVFAVGQLIEDKSHERTEAAKQAAWEEHKRKMNDKYPGVYE